MIHLRVSERIRQEAKRIAAPLIAMYAGRGNSIRSGQGHYYAKIGEMMVAEYFKWKHIDTFDSDLEAIFDTGKSKVEVKVKQRTVIPRAHFFASVAAYNTKQDCDHYLFCSTIGDRELYIVGSYPKGDFLWNSKFYKKGDPDPSAPAGSNWCFRADCYNIAYGDLAPLGEIRLQ